MRTRVKICGLRRLEDVEACIAAGVDALGFNFYARSPRFVTPEEAKLLVARLPPTVVPVGVFVGTSPGEVAEVAQRSAIRAVQLHGEEDPAGYGALGLEILQVIRVRPEMTVLPAPSPSANWVLLDAFVEGFGGEGRRFDWRKAALALGKPVMVAGGITPENVAELIATARPAGIDVASGVESAPGAKDGARVRQLVAAVRALDRNT